ncbi:replication factor A [Methanolobus zinderi]|uniref:Replication factor A n=1 Tax=Methanolobus zinderi TaxID=536044 RepID=A0A7D5HZT9_9EURY|nr:replication factor A [Methanolobus zinderi]KXS45171.1 MAG: nucleic acid-binding OB-fold tRNA/helicase-type protein [Methanolobus sp. T82-4]QLC49226.1 replication factor A [Methanolobus zinderi]
MKDIAQEINSKFLELGVEIPLEDIEERLDKMINKFKVPKEEARRSVVNYFLKEHNIPRNDFYTGQSESPQKMVSDLNSDGKWANVKAKVVQLWENTHESISQVGLVGDETGTIKFTKWERAELPDVEEGKSYLFKNIVVNEWNGKFQINLNKTSSIESIDEDLEVGSSTATFTGAMVDIQSGSGLIKRCPECNRALTKGACMEHGKVDGIYDLRIKAVMDDGTTTQDAIIKRDISEDITDMTLENAIAMAADALDQGVVLEQMKKALVGKYYTISGSRIERYLLVDSIDQKLALDQAELDELITAAEAV